MPTKPKARTQPKKRAPASPNTPRALIDLVRVVRDMGGSFVSEAHVATALHLDPDGEVYERRAHAAVEHKLIERQDGLASITDAGRLAARNGVLPTPQAVKPRATVVPPPEGWAKDVQEMNTLLDDTMRPAPQAPSPLQRKEST